MRHTWIAAALCILASQSLADAAPSDPSDRLKALFGAYVDSGTFSEFRLLPGARDDKGEISVRGGFAAEFPSGTLESGGMALESMREGGLEIFGLFGVLETPEARLEYGNLYALLGSSEPFDPIVDRVPGCTGEARDIAFILGDVNLEDPEGYVLSALVTGIYLRETPAETGCILRAGIDAKGLTVTDGSGSILVEDISFNALLESDELGANWGVSSEDPGFDLFGIGETGIARFIASVLAPFGASALAPTDWMDVP